MKGAILLFPLVGTLGDVRSEELCLTGVLQHRTNRVKNVELLTSSSTLNVFIHVKTDINLV